MRVLVVDDDPLTRRLLVRLLVREFQATTVEAEDGLQALQLLQRDTFELILLDLEMPILDGEDVLAAVRESPALREVPVIVLSGVREEHRVRGVVAAGVSDYLTKPIRPEATSARLARFLARREEADTATPRRPDTGIAPGAALVLVDGEPDFRHCFESTLGDRFHVTTFAEGTEALTACLADPPAALFLGPEIGVLAADLLALKARKSPALAGTRLVAVVPKAGDTTPAAAHWDAAMPKSYVPDVLAAHVDKAIGPAAPAVALADHAALQREVIAATEQTFGHLLGLRLEGAAADGPGESAPGLVATVRLTVPQDEALRLELRVPHDTTQAIVERAAADPGARPLEPEGVLKDAAAQIAGRLRHALDELGLPASSDVAAVTAMAETRPRPPQAFLARFTDPSAASALEVVMAAEPAD